MCNHSHQRMLQDDFKKENDCQQGYLMFSPREYFTRTHNLLMQAGKQEAPELPSNLWTRHLEKIDEKGNKPTRDNIANKSFFGQTNMSKLRKQHNDNKINALNEEKSVNFAMDVTTKSPIYSPTQYRQPFQYETTSFEETFFRNTVQKVQKSIDTDLAVSSHFKTGEFSMQPSL